MTKRIPVPFIVLGCLSIIVSAEAAEKSIGISEFTFLTERIGPFDFALPSDIPPTLDDTSPEIEIPLPGPEVDSRRCTTSELRGCTNACSSQYSTGVIGCRVGTVSGRLTLTCTCGNPGLYTSIQAANDACVQPS